MLLTSYGIIVVVRRSKNYSNIRDIRDDFSDTRKLGQCDIKCHILALRDYASQDV